jgi:hypothetical protein
MDMTLTFFFGAIGLSGVTLFGLYSRSRENLMVDIRNLLEDCRKLSSWDDVRSELKLMSWIEGDERELHKKSLLDLHRVRNSMIKYYQVHLEMQEGAEHGDFQSPPQSLARFVVHEVLGLQRKK